MKHNWEYNRLGDICSFIGGGTPSKSNEAYYSGKIPWATVRDMLEFHLSNTELSISEDAVSESATNVLPKGMIVISTHVGLGKICELMQDTAINQDLKGVSFSNDIVNKYFFVYWYRSIANYIISKGRGATVKGVTLDFMKNLSIPVPPRGVQSQIVAELDKINEVIADCRELLRNLDALAQSLFYDTFGDPISNPKGWILKTWDDCLNIINGKNQKGVENSNGKYPIYGSGGIMNYADDFLCPEDCTIIGRKGNISRPIFVKTKFWNVDTAFGLCPDKTKLSPLYLFFFCKNYDFERHNKAVTIPSLVKSDLLKIIIPIPPLALQEKFARRIEQIDAQKKAIEETITNLQTLLDSRMDYWFN